MICPTCGFDNVPGVEECTSCLQDLTQLDRPTAQDRVERSLMEDHVQALNPHVPVKILPNATIQQAIHLMNERKVGALLVVDDQGDLAGILSERDILYKIVGLHHGYDELLVKDFMTLKPESVTADDTLAFALHKMDVGGYRHLPVLKDGKPSGVISVRDMLRHITHMC